MSLACDNKDIWWYYGFISVGLNSVVYVYGKPTRSYTLQYSYGEQEETEIHSLLYIVSIVGELFFNLILFENGNSI